MSPTPSPTPTPTPPPDPIVANGSFEAPYSSGIADEWTSFVVSGSPNFNPASINKKDGSNSQYWARTDTAPFVGGVYQTVSVTSGYEYSITAWLKRQSVFSGTTLQAGYDLTGGTNPSSGNIVWTDLTSSGNNTWIEWITPNITATGSSMTLFFKGGHTSSSGDTNAYFYVDYAAVWQNSGNGNPSETLTRPGIKAIMPLYNPFNGDIPGLSDYDPLGVTMARLEFIKDGSGNIVYTAYDDMVDDFAGEGIEVLGLIDYQSLNHGGPSSWGTSGFKTDFVNRVTQIVTHYNNRTNKIEAWEMWNEPDLSVTGFDVRIEPEPYGAILVDCYNAIKAIDADATVVFGGISPKGFEYTEDYLQDVYDSTAVSNFKSTNGYSPFDVVGAHPYPEIFTDPDSGLATVLNERVKATMNDNGDSDMKVWITELGWNSYVPSLGESFQAQYLTDSFLIIDTLTDPENPSNGPYVEKYFWFKYNEWGNDHWGLLTEDLSRRKPSFAAYKGLQ